MILLNIHVQRFFLCLTQQRKMLMGKQIKKQKQNKNSKDNSQIWLNDFGSILRYRKLTKSYATL